MKLLVLLRPEPGLTASTAAARRFGLDVIACPLFEIAALPWIAPPAAKFDALLLTSANAVRCAGPGVAAYRDLPVLAVGAATADAARGAGLRVETVGERGVAALLGAVAKDRRLLHLAGQHHCDHDRELVTIAVYAAVELSQVPPFPIGPAVIAVHSPRAGRRLAELLHDRAGCSIAAISTAAAQSCGGGWARVDVASDPSDPSLLALAARLCQD